MPPVAMEAHVWSPLRPRRVDGRLGLAPRHASATRSQDFIDDSQRLATLINELRRSAMGYRLRGHADKPRSGCLMSTQPRDHRRRPFGPRLCLFAGARLGRRTCGSLPDRPGLLLRHEKCSGQTCRLGAEALNPGSLHNGARAKRWLHEVSGDPCSALASLSKRSTLPCKRRGPLFLPSDPCGRRAVVGRTR